MHKRRLLWQLFPVYLLTMLLTLLAAGWYGSRTLKEFYYEKTGGNLMSRARLLEEEITRQLAKGEDYHRIDDLCERLGGPASTRLTVILPNGRVVGDSEKPADEMENHADRPEIIAALAGTPHPSVRPSDTLGIDMMYVAIPLERDGRVLGVLRTSVPVMSIEGSLRAVRWQVAGGVLVVAILAAVASWFLARRITQPLEQLKRGAEQFARGDFSHRLPTGDSVEVAALSETMNQMAAELDARLRTVIRQRNEVEAVLSSMVEGVVAVDQRHRVITLNQAGARLLTANFETARGRSLEEVVRNPRLLALVESVFSEKEAVEDEIVLYDPDERYLHAQGTVLRDMEPPGARPGEIGVLVVLHDVTQLRRLERVRRDFVANVSHELRTPITSIKGFVETLLDGALQQPDDAVRFLSIVAIQTDRLNAIIEDLLTLSRLEQDPQRTDLTLEPGRIREILESAVAVCEPAVTEKDLTIDLTCDPGLQANVNAALLEQAVVNLVGNAVKYSDQGQTIHVEAEQVPSGEIVLRVRDHGCGIAREHLPRLFERFYRVDKARSRKLGGTGLGLAIVKHIMQLHGGRATVQSEPGEGSIFSLHLPHPVEASEPA
ncbi:MAG: HAMP domain-containing protein [Pirellulales bacterium]|nr:HAMP domain-containing protein [Pirellulales bacterium]